jgi:plasmid maintenance system killer protein
VEISYKTRKLEKQLTDPFELVKSFGLLAKKIKMRLKNLSDADNLGVLRSLPATGCHELSGNRQGQLAVNISVNYRLVFEPANEPVPFKADGGLNWNAVTKIRIIEIVDYHK